MSFLSFCISALLGLGMADAAVLKPRSYTYSSTCDDGKRAVIDNEIIGARNLLGPAITSPNTGIYYTTFFPKSFTDNPDFWQTVSKVYTNINNMLDNNYPDYSFEITCDNTTPKCRSGYLASMYDANKRMNFCDNFFIDVPDSVPGKKILSYERVINQCSTIDLRAAQLSRPAIIIHELTHTGFAMSPAGRTKDYAYGLNGNYLLPLGKYDRSCAPKLTRTILCPDPNDPTKEGICPAEKAVENADSWSFVAAGVGFSRLCNRDIPLPTDLPPTRKRSVNPSHNVLQKRDCPGADYIEFDDGAVDDNPEE